MDEHNDGSRLSLQEATRVRPLDKTGAKWEVVLLREGASRNRGKRNPNLARYYPGKTVQEAARLFEGAWSLLDHRTDSERMERPGGRVLDRAGFFSGCRAVQAPSDGKWEARAVFECIDGRLRENLLNAWKAGRPDYAGFSIDADATGFSELKLPDGSLVEAVDGLSTVHSIDVVTTPAAGGGFTNILEADMTVSTGTETLSVTRADLAAIAQEAAEAAASRVEARLAATLQEALEEDEELDEDEDFDPEDFDPEDEDDEDDEGDDEDEDEWEDEEGDVTEGLLHNQGVLEERLQEAEFRSWRLQADLAISEAKDKFMQGLPAASQERVTAELTRLADAGLLSTTIIQEAVTDERNYLGRIMQQNPAGSNPAQLRQPDAVSTEWYDKAMGMYLGRSVNGQAPFSSLKEAYFTHPSNLGKSTFYTSPYEILGAFAVPYDSMTAPTNVREAIYTTNFGVVMADVMHQAMQKRLTELPYDAWRKVVSQIQSVQDFRDHRWARVGSYDNLPTVGQGAPYQPMTSPTTEEAKYSIAKYGGLESISLEAIANDQVGATAGIPQRLAYAFARTLYESVLDTVTTANPVLTYDTTALYHANHGNIDTNPLTTAGVYAAQLAMRKLRPYGAPATEFMGERNRITLAIVPPDLEARAQRIFGPGSDTQYITQTAVSDAGAVTRETDAALGIDPGYFRNKGVDVLVYDKAYLTSTSRYWLMGDKNLIDTVAVGFFMGRQTPDLFVQDANVPSGAAFTADMVTYKIRAFWGVGVLEHRGLRQEGA